MLYIKVYHTSEYTKLTYSRRLHSLKLRDFPGLVRQVTQNCHCLIVLSDLKQYGQPDWWTFFVRLEAKLPKFFELKLTLLLLKSNLLSKDEDRKSNTGSNVDSRSSRKCFLPHLKSCYLSRERQETSNNYSTYSKWGIICNSKLQYSFHKQIHLFIVNCYVIPVVFSSSSTLWLLLNYLKLGLWKCY